jgi:hypothetical protein
MARELERRKMMESEANAAVIQLARALSDPTRLRIAARLVDAELTIEQIAAELRLRMPDVSRHLKLLIDSRLVVEADGTGIVSYRLNLDELQRISRAAFATERPTSPEIEGEAWEQKVLRDFVKDGRLTSIPASHKKKLVVLRWLATEVPPGTRLSERQISALLERYHPDFATLRRELVDNGFLERERSVYWRVDEEQVS